MQREEKCERLWTQSLTITDIKEARCLKILGFDFPVNNSINIIYLILKKYIQQNVLTACSSDEINLLHKLFAWFFHSDNKRMFNYGTSFEAINFTTAIIVLSYVL